MNVNAILSEDYAGILDVAEIGPEFSFDGREEFDFFFDEKCEGKKELWTDGEFSILDADYDEPTVMVFRGGKPIGFYFDMMAWVDEEYRGRGLASRMILCYADHFGDHAFAEQRKKADCAMGFSQEGYDLHTRVLEIARHMSAQPSPLPSP